MCKEHGRRVAWCRKCSVQEIITSLFTRLEKECWRTSENRSNQGSGLGAEEVGAPAFVRNKNDRRLL